MMSNREAHNEQISKMKIQPAMIASCKLLETPSARLPGEGNPVSNRHGSNITRQTVAYAAGKHAMSFQPLT